MFRGKSTPKRDDSFTSVTSASTVSSVEVLEKSKKRDWRKLFRMGQKNTHENKAGSRSGSGTNSPSAMKGGKSVAGKDRTDRKAENDEHEFVDVLDSDEEERNGENIGQKEEERDFGKAKYKLNSLSGDLLSDASDDENTMTGKDSSRRSEDARAQISERVKENLLLTKESSSEDDYDQPEGIEPSLEQSKAALQNWRRLISKVTEEEDRLRSKDMERDAETTMKESSENGSSERAKRNWKNVVGKVKKTKDPLIAVTLKELAGKDNRSKDYSENNSSDDDDMGNGSPTRALENWKMLVTKAKSKVNALASLRERLERGDIDTDSSVDEENESSNQQALKNWGILVSCLMEGKPEVMSVRNILTNKLEELEDEARKNENSERGMGAPEDGEVGQRAVNNWRRMTSNIIGKYDLNRGFAGLVKAGNIRDDVDDNSDDYDGEKDGDGSTDQHSDESDEFETEIRILRKWEKIVSKLLEKYEEKNMSFHKLIAMRSTSDNDSVENDDNMDGSDSEERGVQANKRPLRNWERIVSRLRENFEAEKTDVRMIFSKFSSDGQTNSRNEVNDKSRNFEEREKESRSTRVILNWENVVRKLLTKHSSRNMDAKKLLKSYMKNEVTSSEEENSDSEAKDLNKIKISSTSSSQALKGENKVNSTKARTNWRTMTTKLINESKMKGPSIRNALGDKIRETKKRGENDTTETEATSNALRNWERILSKVVDRSTNGDRSVYGVLKVKMNEGGYGDRNSNTSTDSEISETDKRHTNAKKLNTLKNWKRIFTKIVDLTKGNGTLLDHELDGLDLEDDVCYACRNKYEFPILLSCSHTFCRDCITELIEKSSGVEFMCPKCRFKHQLSEEDEELFCPNFVVLKQMQQEKSGDSGCRYCGKDKKAELLCEQCADLYCPSCGDKHIKQDVYRDHTLLDIASIENRERFNRKYFCLKHRKEELSVYCLACDTSLCPKCAKRKHKGADHDCGSISEAALAGREILLDATRRLEERPDLRSEYEKVENMQHGLDAELEEMREEIKKCIENMIAKLRQRELELYEDVEKKHAAIYDALSERKENARAAMLQSENFRQFLKDLQKHKNDVEMLQMQAAVSDRMSEILEMKAEENPEIDYDFVFTSRDDIIREEIAKLGTVNIKDRKSGRMILVEEIEDDDENDNDYRVMEYEEGQEMTEKNDRTFHSWSPTETPREGSKEGTRSGHQKAPQPKQEQTNHSQQKKDIHTKLKQISHQQDSGSEEEIEGHIRERKRKNRTHGDKKREKTDVRVKNEKEGSVESLKQTYEEIPPKTYEFEGSRSPPYEGFTQLTSERGENVNTLKYGVKNYKNETCDVQIRMICPDQSIVSAHVAENADGAFTVFFCPEIKKDFNCFITIGGKHFKKEYKILNFYGNFQGMRSKEIDLACRAMSLLRWHVTPGLLENRHGKVKRSKKFFKILGNHRS